MTRVVLGVTGGVAAYKAVEVLRSLRESDLDVTVVPTQAALRFVGETTWAALSGEPIASDVWSTPEAVRHVAVGQNADLVLVAPATADFLARAVHGVATDLLTNVLLTASCPVVVAPAMHTEMWQHPATQANVRLLRERGVLVLDPSVGRLTGADSGPGRLPDPAAIVDVAHAVLRRGAVHEAMDMVGVRVLISAGGTREPWDDVRYLGNRSSGRQGIALARSALARGAEVHMVLADVHEAVPAGCHVTRIETAEELRVAMHAAIGEWQPDVVVMAAAVADFRPSRRDVPQGKITKEALDAGPGETATPELDLERTSDVLAEIVAKRGAARSPVVVGFAAEVPEAPETLEQRAQAKLARKGCDLLVANDVSGGAVFGQPTTSVVIVGKAGVCARAEGVDKSEVGHLLWDCIDASAS